MMMITKLFISNNLKLYNNKQNKMNLNTFKIKKFFINNSNLSNWIYLNLKIHSINNNQIINKNINK